MAYGLVCAVPLTVIAIVPVPPDALNVNSPFEALHAASVFEAVKLTIDGSVITKVVDNVQLFASVAITVYVPAPFVAGLVAALPSTVYEYGVVPPLTAKLKLPSAP